MLWDFLGWFGMGKHIPILLFPPEGSLLITHCLGEKHLDLVKQACRNFWHPWVWKSRLGAVAGNIFQVFPCSKWLSQGSCCSRALPLCFAHLTATSLDLYPKVGMLQVGTAQQSLENTRAASPGILHGAGRRIWRLTGPKGLQTGRNFFQCSYSLAST